MPDTACVLCVSGHDPGGGAGVHADIEAVAAQGAHALSVISVLTVQDTQNVVRSVAVDADLMAQQLDALQRDCRIRAVKIGLLGSLQQVSLLRQTIAGGSLPVVLDPVLAAGGGTRLVDEQLRGAIREQLIPHVSLLTPNQNELGWLVPEADKLAAAATQLLSEGCGGVLVTGGDADHPRITNTWHRPQARPLAWHWTRADETFHGAGCTLASAIAAQLAIGSDMRTAIGDAQQWTQQTLRRARAIGEGRRIPGRVGR